MRKRRRFTPESQAKVVLGLLAGTQSPAEACRKHSFSPNRLGLWKSSFLERARFQSDERRALDQARIFEPEHLPGRITRRIEVITGPRRGRMRPRPETGYDQDRQG